jgi:UDP-N-acetylmuramoyl-L-alanyl-D-glutamate--2,6-diaminopimelate ligase
VPEGPYLVAGLARAGQAAISALRELDGHPVTAWDALVSPATRAAQRRLRADGIEAHLGQEPEPGELLRSLQPRCIVKSPGIRPDNALVAAAAAQVSVIDELELGWRLARAPIVAVTGTNGKSTVSALIHAVLQRVGVGSALVGNTLYGPPLSAASRHAGALVCEVSSYQLEACPTFVPAVAVFTNLTRDHLHRHGSMARYADCKRGLFHRDGRGVTPLAVVNADDAFGRRLAHEVRDRGGECVLFGNHPSAQYRIRSCDWTLSGSRIEIVTPHGHMTLRSRLPGAHNASNVAAALAVAGSIGVPVDRARGALEGAHAPPGRFEIVARDRPFDVVVDYAHSPDGFRQALHTARRILDDRPGDGRLRVVAGIVGGHDPVEQHHAGQILCAQADDLVLTASNLRGERPLPLVQDMLRGARTVPGGTARAVLDRKAAIAETLAAANPGDIVLVLGRGALTRQMNDRSGIWHDFDDRAVVGTWLAEQCLRQPA